ncbi:malto-oligosyltrehalose trehalohydrolase [Methylobacillus arboreus]|uniref:malto-oligosyltrehalose trehalohydrolase n=1 Tax=Methylobacillus arboreus TaxID=755170 RepID=UPI001E513BC0|nr:malto-oligosyltrehalose trehalohydrolase [Methylobacillus arboreus]MCB5191460.1 malto-oligosyltrehalose trehalohydrolase [Methylobacillus arboreus]
MTLYLQADAMPKARRQDTHMRLLPAGAHILEPGKVRFRLWAPNAEKVWVVLPGGEEHALVAEAGASWFSLELAADAGAQYRYRVRNKQGQELLVPDPWSRAQADGVHGSSLVIDPQAYLWRNQDWAGRPWHESIILEVHAGALGGYQGVRAQLPQWAAMGFTAIELMPVASFPGNRNWGYDGVLQFAPQYSYGSPDELKALIDDAHGLGISVYLDVVYNHFGPDGNYLHHYAPQFFCHQHQTPWGDAIDFAQPEVLEFYTENALYWLEEFQFDGLRLDACHAIWDQAFLLDIAARIRQEFDGRRHIHLMAENDHNSVTLLQNGYDAQWNDDSHHVLHVLLTGETGGYYADYAEHTMDKLARCLGEGFVYQGEISAHRHNQPRGEPSSGLTLSSFIIFLQNHDQIGNRAFGERLAALAPEPALKVASALLLLSPHVPLMFMGEEYGATEPFLYFTNHEDPALANAVREGRRAEFATFPQFQDTSLAERIPDPNAEASFEQSIPHDHQTPAQIAWREWISHLLQLRHLHLLPHLEQCRALRYAAFGPAAVYAQWQLGNGAILTLAVNLGAETAGKHLDELVSGPAQVLLNHGNAHAALATGEMPAYSVLACLEPPLALADHA